MAFKYIFDIRMPVRDFIPTIKNFEDSVNESMKGVGFDEKMITTFVFPIELIVQKEMTNEEIQKVQDVIEGQVRTHYGYASIECIHRERIFE